MAECFGPSLVYLSVDLEVYGNELSSVGSGFIVDRIEMIFTSAHVVVNLEKIDLESYKSSEKNVTILSSFCIVNAYNCF